MKALSAAEILAAEDRKIVRVEVPEWGGCVYVRGMTGRERDAYEIRLYGSGATKRDIRAALAASTLCDESGAPLFDLTQVEALSAKSGAALDRVFAVAARLSKITKADIDELEKNCEANLSGCS